MNLKRMLLETFGSPIVGRSNQALTILAPASATHRSWSLFLWLTEMALSWSASVRKARPRSVRMTATIVVMRRAEPDSPRLHRIVSRLRISRTSEAGAVGVDKGVTERDAEGVRIGDDRHVAPGRSRISGHRERVDRPDRVADVDPLDLRDERVIEDVAD